jgi:acetate kinase
MHSVLAINSGSSSLRFALFKADESLSRTLTGTFDRIGRPDARLSFADVLASQTDERRIDAPNHVAYVPLLVELLEQNAGVNAVTAIGHRVVHGGPRYRDPQRVEDAMIEELRRISSFAPNHLSSAIALMETLAAKFSQVPQIACFDTAFHHAMPRVAKLLPIPRRYEAKGVQRYGFHGLSYAYLMDELARLGDPSAKTGRVILAHLGNGASMAAVRDGQSLDTSMGFTPAAGMMMSTRSGDLDPGLVAFLGRSEQMTRTQFDQMIHHESGLLGVSGISSDMRDLLAGETADVLAQAAVKEGVDRAMSALLLRPFGTQPRRVLLGLMLITLLFSMWMSNTATTAMMMALVTPMLAAMPPNEPFRKAIVLGVPFAANIGGMGTPIASPPNAVAMGFLQKAGHHVAFLDWMLVAAPLVTALRIHGWKVRC